MSYHSMNPIQVIAVTGGKGGVGKTNVAVNLGIALSKLGRRVTLLDAALGLGNADVVLGIKTRKTLKDVLNGDIGLMEVIVPGPCGLSIVPAASGAQDMVSLGSREYAGLIHAFSDIDEHMDILIIDTAAGIRDEVTSFLKAAREILLVVCNEPASIADAYALVKVMHEVHGIEHIRVLANMIRSEQEGRELFTKLVTVSERFLEVILQYAGAIPFDENIRRAVQRQKAVVQAYPKTAASHAYSKLAATVDSWPVASQSRGHLEFFVEQLVANA